MATVTPISRIWRHGRVARESCTNDAPPAPSGSGGVRFPALCYSAHRCASVRLFSVGCSRWVGGGGALWGVGQLADRPAVNREVGGSSPPAPALEEADRWNPLPTA